MSASVPDPGQPTRTTDRGDVGFFRALFDLSFNHFVTPKIVKVVYVVGLVLIGLLTLVVFFSAFRHFGDGFGASPLLGVVQLLAAPLLGIFYLAFFRMSLELYYAVIRLSEDVHHGPSRSI